MLTTTVVLRICIYNNRLHAPKAQILLKRVARFHCSKSKYNININVYIHNTITFGIDYNNVLIIHREIGRSVCVSPAHVPRSRHCGSAATALIVISNHILNAHCNC